MQSALHLVRREKSREIRIFQLQVEQPAALLDAVIGLLKGVGQKGVIELGCGHVEVCGGPRELTRIDGAG